MVADGKLSSPLYLKQFFQDLTFADLPSLSLPLSLPDNSLLKYSWIRKDPGLINPSLFCFGERIPSLPDISPILQEVSERQAEGFQGVELTLMEEGWCTTRHVSIEMIRRYTHIHNATPHIRLASQLHASLLSHLHAHPSISLTTIIERLSTFPIHRDLPGYSLLVPIYELRSLSGDHEVEDDVANIQLKLLYLHHSLAAAPRNFILPVFFPCALLEAYARSPRTYTPLLSKLRSSISLSIMRQWFAGLSFIHCSGFHYTSYHVDRHGRLFWGNSISGEPSPLQELSDVLRWFLDGLGISVASILSMGMPPQKAWSHDCALFALEGIRSRVDLGLPWLRLADITQLRLEWIVELLTHSFRANLHPHLSWYDMPISSDLAGPVPKFLGSYSWEDDWTLYEVIQHPIFQVAVPLAPVSILPRSLTHSSSFSDSDEHTSESSYPTSDSDYQPSSRMESLDISTP
ncbi:hypothetical protein FRC04_005960 [Tulasnella sp. 424]|nr:hypothetical protein FRC04_005960 [Tulasnella sp. 424]